MNYLELQVIQRAIISNHKKIEALRILQVTNSLSPSGDNVSKLQV